MNFKFYLTSFFLLSIITAVSCIKKTVNAFQKPLVVVGSSAAGTAAIESLIKHRYAGDVLWISDQPREESPYYTVDLPHVFENKKTIEQINIFDVNSLPKNIKPIFGKRVESINPDEHSLVLNDGQSITFGKLLLAIGMQYKPPLEFAGQNIKGIFTFGRYSDVKAIDEHLKNRSAKNVVIVGFGLIAADVINGLVKERSGITTHILVRGNRILDRYVDEVGASIVLKDLEGNGLKVHTMTSVKSIVQDSHGYVKGVILNDGSQLDCEMIIFATGPVIQERLFAEAGIRTEHGGVWADLTLQTNQKDIFVAGDGVLIKNLATGNSRPSSKWGDARVQGETALQNMLGKNKKYDGSSFPLRINFLNTKIVSCGPVSELLADCQKIVRHDGKRYAMFLYKNEKLLGFLLMNIKNRFLPFRLKSLIEDGKKMSKKEVESLAKDAFAGGSIVKDGMALFKEARKFKK